MKKTIVALASLAAFASASSFATTGNFTWGGTIPAQEEATPGFVIQQLSSTGFGDGVLQFDSSAANVELIDSSNLTFTVTDESGTAVAYQYRLNETKVAMGGIPQTDNNWLFISDDNTDALTTTPVVATAGTTVTLNVLDNAANRPLSADVYGQDVLVQGIVEVAASF